MVAVMLFKTLPLEIQREFIRECVRQGVKIPDLDVLLDTPLNLLRTAFVWQISVVGEAWGEVFTAREGGLYRFLEELYKIQYPKDKLTRYHKLPEELRKALMEEQGKAPNPTSERVFTENVFANKKEGGFDWEDSKVIDCWADLIIRGEYEKFDFDAYRKVHGFWYPDYLLPHFLKQCEASRCNFLKPYKDLGFKEQEAHKYFIVCNNYECNDSKIDNANLRDCNVGFYNCMIDFDPMECTPQEGDIIKLKEGDYIQIYKEVVTEDNIAEAHYGVLDLKEAKEVFRLQETGWIGLLDPVKEAEKATQETSASTYIKGIPEDKAISLMAVTETPKIDAAEFAKYKSIYNSLKEIAKSNTPGSVGIPSKDSDKIFHLKNEAEVARIEANWENCLSLSLKKEEQLEQEIKALQSRLGTVLKENLSLKEEIKILSNRLSESEVSLVKTITENKKLTEELEEKNNLLTKKNKKTMNAKNMFSNVSKKLMAQFMPVKDNNVKIAMDGTVCVKKILEKGNAREGTESVYEYWGYNAATGQLTAYPEEMCIALPSYVISRPVSQVKVGDIIKGTSNVENNYGKVVSVSANGHIKVQSFAGYNRERVPVTDFMTGTSTVKVVINPFSTISGFNPMMFAMMDEDADMENIFLMSMLQGAMNPAGNAANPMGGMFGNMNPMMAMMLMKDKDNDGEGKNSMFETMAMMSMIGNGQGMFGGMFGAPVQAAPQVVTPVQVKPAPKAGKKANKEGIKAPKANPAPAEAEVAE